MIQDDWHTYSHSYLDDKTGIKYDLHVYSYSCQDSNDLIKFMWLQTGVTDEKRNKYYLYTCSYSWDDETVTQYD